MNPSLGFDDAREIALAQRTALVPEAGAEVLSGARIERVVLADGRRFVLKRLPPDGDWLTRATLGVGRLRRLWDSGVLAQAAATVDHGILAVLVCDGADVLLMRDLSHVLFPATTAVSRAQACRVLAGLAAFHRDGEGCRVDGLCLPGARYHLSAPGRHARDDRPNPAPIRGMFMAGWEAFVDLVPSDVTDAVFAVHRNPEPLGAALVASAPPTLLHGDFKPGNLGLDGERLVAIDWGELTGIGPAEIDVAYFAVHGGWRIDWLPSDAFAAYEAQSGRSLCARALDLACIGSLAQLGYRMAFGCRAQDAAMRARSSVLLAWWIDRVRQALLTWSPI